MKNNAPIKLSSARAWRTYTGGSEIDKIHGKETRIDGHFPEDWIISCVVAFNVGREDIVEGLNFIEGSDMSLKEYIEKNSLEALGEGHIKKWGVTLGVLVKIIDAAERLTVQVHPNKEKAMELFQSQFGKTECWHILGGRTIDGEEPSIYFGFKEGVTREEWKRCFDEQDIPALLGLMHHFYVKPGDTFLIKGGVPHAIGQGCLLVEIQEPTDYTIRVERTTPQGLQIADRQCHCGIGFDKMFDCFDYDGVSAEEAKRRWMVPAKVLEAGDGFERKEIIGYNETSCFSLERLDIQKSETIKGDGNFTGLYVLSGKGTLISAEGEEQITSGDQFFVPATSEPYTLKAEEGKPLVVFRCLGPQH